MVWHIQYTEKAIEELKQLPKKVAKRILDKVHFFGEQPNPLQFAKRLTDFRMGTYRFRVGDYRIIFDIDHDGTMTIIYILSVKHRKDVYR